MHAQAATTYPTVCRRAYPCAPVISWVSDLLGPGWTSEAWVDDFSSLPGRKNASARPDSLGVVAGNVSGHGCIFFTGVVAASRLAPRDKALWSRIAVHLATGYRLALQRETPTDAVLSPAGKLLHLESGVDAHQGASLSTATRAIDRARSKLRRTDPERALALWKGLVEGQWSLVDQFDHDGRRYVLAKRNTPAARPWRLLTDREAQVVAHAAEGQTHKLIAYQLGISTGTVALDLARARAKVSARSLLDLVAAYRAARQDPS
jgi:DNA-binding CsgD family transcriptional regulator